MRSISELVGEEKPSQRMFHTAFAAMHLTETDKPYIYMVGNNIKKDIVGANRFGIVSVLETWSARYNMIPESAEEEPRIRIASPLELLEYIE